MTHTIKSKSDIEALRENYSDEVLFRVIVDSEAEVLLSIPDMLFFYDGQEFDAIAWTR